MGGGHARSEGTREKGNAARTTGVPERCAGVALLMHVTWVGSYVRFVRRRAWSAQPGKGDECQCDPQVPGSGASGEFGGSLEVGSQFDKAGNTSIDGADRPSFDSRSRIAIYPGATHLGRRMPVAGPGVGSAPAVERDLELPLVFSPSCWAG